MRYYEYEPENFDNIRAEMMICLESTELTDAVKLAQAVRFFDELFYLAKKETSRLNGCIGGDDFIVEVRITPEEIRKRGIEKLIKTESKDDAHS